MLFIDYFYLIFQVFMFQLNIKKNVIIHPINFNFKTLHFKHLENINFMLLKAAIQNIKYFYIIHLNYWLFNHILLN